MASIIAAILLIGTLGVLVLLPILAINAFDDDNAVMGWTWSIAALLVLVGGTALLLEASSRSGLCERGHETYQLVGKSMQRVWVCDQEADQ